ncbi:MAG: pilus assembly protein N-terminal domain-containing protein, partial [Mariprofundus sp.]
MRTQSKGCRLGSLLGMLLWLFAGMMTPVWAADTFILHPGDRAGELDLPVGKIILVSSPVHLKQVAIGNPDIADVKLLDSKSVLIQGKAAGRTNLAFRNRKMELIALLDVIVGYDIAAIKHKLYQVLPNEPGIEVRSANSHVILFGEVSNAMAMDVALVIARSFAPNSVSNLLQVGGGQQVMLEVRIAEVGRSSLKSLGVQGAYSGNAGRVGINAATTAAVAGAFGTLGMVYKGLDLTLSALESQGLARVLAEPNLVAMSGEEGSFLVGGEFPIVTVTTVGQPSVEYKAFGVGMKFTPVVLNSSKINLVLQAEVSAIDATQTVVGSNYPVLKTRRTSTTVEVADGKSFAIAGLIQSDINNA